PLRRSNMSYRVETVTQKAYLWERSEKGQRFPLRSCWKWNCFLNPWFEGPFMHCCTSWVLLPLLGLFVVPVSGSAFAAEPEAPALPEKVTFSEQIAPIVFTQCTLCHRPGEAAPFSLMNYNDVRKHARTIVRAISSRYMPPWQPDPGYGEYLNARRL